MGGINASFVDDDDWSLETMLVCVRVRAVPGVPVFSLTSTDSVDGCRDWHLPPSCEVSPTRAGSSTTDHTASCRVPMHCFARRPTAFARAFGRWQLRSLILLAT